MQEQIDEIMDCFDFEKVAKAMKALDWSWGFSDNASPSVPELRQRARELLRSAVDRKAIMATGGFVASYKSWDDGDSLELVFQVDSWDCWVDNNE